MVKAGTYEEAFAGIDIGSRSIELFVMKAGGLFEQAQIPTTFDPVGQCRKLVNGLRVNRVVATGYGRKLFAESFPELSVATITEIQAYAIGARYLFPEAGTVLDIGGQDTKVISLSAAGKVMKHVLKNPAVNAAGIQEE